MGTPCPRGQKLSSRCVLISRRLCVFPSVPKRPPRVQAYCGCRRVRVGDGHGGKHGLGARVDGQAVGLDPRYRHHPAVRVPLRYDAFMRLNVGNSGFYINILAASLSCLLTQCFFAWRLWRVSKNRLLVGVIVTGSVMQLGGPNVVCPYDAGLISISCGDMGFLAMGTTSSLCPIRRRAVRET